MSSVGPIAVGSVLSQAAPIASNGPTVAVKNAFASGASRTVLIQQDPSKSISTITPVTGPRVAITGLGTALNAAQLAGSREQAEANFGGYAAEAPVTGQGSRGYLRCEATPIPSGCRLHVTTFHGLKSDAVTLYLVAEVLDQQTQQLRTITLSVLADATNLVGDSWRKDYTFDISYDDINAFLQERNPRLKVSPGLTTLAVAGSWADGHEAGGFGRAGTFRLPALAGTHSAVSIQTAGVTGNDQADLPLDMEVPYPVALQTAVPQLKHGGAIVSRLESELKGTATQGEMTAAIHQMYQLAATAKAGRAAEVERVLGKNWTVKTVDRYWLTDDGSDEQPGKAGTGYFAGYRVDANELPIQDAMYDTYMDDDTLRMTRQAGAIRLRKNSAATILNVKPGGGRLDDKTQIVQRVEYGLELEETCGVGDAGRALRDLGSGAHWSTTVFYQAHRQVRALGEGLNLTDANEPWLDIVQDRHKFTLSNTKTGVEVEFSFDKVVARTRRPSLCSADGNPREAEFYVFEAELNHLQLGSSNQGAFQAEGAIAGSFVHQDGQDQWLRETSEEATLNVEPRLHDMADLNNETFRTTESYRVFENLVGRLAPTLFPKGLHAARQKAAHAAELMHLVSFDDKELLHGLKLQVIEAGYLWSEALEAALLKAIADPTARTGLEERMCKPSDGCVYDIICQYTPPADVEYDPKKIKERIRSRLHSLGYYSSAAIEALFDNITPKALPPSTFESNFADMATKPDNMVMESFAQSLHVLSPPIPKPAVRYLLGDSQWGQTLRSDLWGAGVDPTQVAAVEQFLVDAAHHGVAISDLRAAITRVGYMPQGLLDEIAANINLEAPQLRANPDALCNAVNAALAPEYLFLTGDLRPFVANVAATASLEQAKVWASEFALDPRCRIATEAALMGLPTPQYVFAEAGFHRKMAGALRTAFVHYDAPLRAFAKAAVEAGAQVTTVASVFSELVNSVDLRSAMSKCRLFSTGLELPPIRRDLGVIVGHLRTELSEWSDAFASGPALTKFVADGLAGGMKPWNLIGYAVELASKRRKDAVRGLPRVISNPPSAPIDIDGLCQHWQTCLGDNWTGAHDTYARQALGRVVSHDDFCLVEIYDGSPGNIIETLERLSGIAHPRGL